MRICIPGISRRGRPFEFSFDGTRIPAYAGESIASALVAAGRWNFREARSGASRGMFCGMGVCGECQVRIDGDSRRACLEPARPGLTVTHSPSHAPVQADAPPGPAPGTWEEITTQVLVIGAGPAGLSAARRAARSGLDVLVVDERQKAGGQFFKQPGEGFDVDERGLDAQFAEGRELYRDAHEAGAKFLLGATVWGAFFPGEIAITAQGRTQVIRAQRLVLSTGTFERAVPVPGWTLPGVLTTGAAQTLLRAYQTSPGKRVLIAGNGPLNLQVAHELVRAGITVVAIAEHAPPPYLAAPGSLLRMALNAPGLCLTGVRHLFAMKSAGVPIHYRHALVEAQGAAKVERAVIAQVDAGGHALPGTQKTFDVDAICVNSGFLPQSELARSLGCRFRYDAVTATLSAERNEAGRTNVDHIFIVGDAGGLGGARVAIAQGELAGAEVTKDLGRSSRAARNLPRLRRTLRRHRRFQEALWRVFQAPVLTTQLARPDTLICRCEEIDMATLEEHVREHPGGLGSIKRATRAGMGRCQGRYCTTLIAALLGENGASTPTADDFFAPRVPFKPLALAALAGKYGEELAAVDVLRTPGRDANKTC